MPPFCSHPGGSLPTPAPTAQHSTIISSSISRSSSPSRRRHPLRAGSPRSPRRRRPRTLRAGRTGRPPGRPPPPCPGRHPRLLHPRDAPQAERRPRSDHPSPLHPHHARNLRHPLHPALRPRTLPHERHPPRPPTGAVRHMARHKRKGGAAMNPHLLRRYIFTPDHRTIGRQYRILALIAATIGPLLSLLMRIHLVWPNWPLPLHGPILPEDYLALVTIHGTIT